MLPAIWREVLRGRDHVAIAREMAARGWLVLGEGRHLARKVSIRGYGKPRLFHVTGRFIGGEDD